MKKPNEGCNILEVDVSKVAPIPENEVENFKKERFNEIYLRWEVPEAIERDKIGYQLMFKRWDWIHENPETYVNMLRVKGFTDEQIQDCLDGKRPLSYPTREIFAQFKKDLVELKAKLEQEFEISNIWYAQTGSSVPGYSSNPCKGFPAIPSKLSDPQSSDIDIIIIADNIKNIEDIMDKKNIKHYSFNSITDRKNEFPTTRLGTFQLAELSTSLGDFEKKWKEILPAGFQITFQNGVPMPNFPPWELPIDIDHI